MTLHRATYENGALEKKIKNTKDNKEITAPKHIRLLRCIEREPLIG